LDVSNNSFDGQLPASLSRLKRLEYLNCSQNNLTGVVPDLRLLKLEALHLDRNELTGSLDGISRLRNLEVLNASRNQFTGGLPELDKLPRLKACFLGHNRLAGRLSSVAIAGSLVELYVNDNLLDVSDLPAAFARLDVCFTARNSVPPPPGPAG
jgi:Leucine-rich repeat (LRR) protein